MSDESVKRCKATSSRTGQPCRRYPVRGATVCPTHGGGAPQVKRKAAERRALAKFAKAYGGGPAALDVDPASAVLRELSWSSVHVAWLRAKLQEEGAEWADRYDRERGALMNLARTAHAMGIAEREIALAERYGAELQLLIVRVVHALPVGARTVARQAFERELRVLDGGASGHA